MKICMSGFCLQRRLIGGRHENRHLADHTADGRSIDEWFMNYKYELVLNLSTLIYYVVTFCNLLRPALS